MNILLPIEITQAMIGTGTNIAEVDTDAGEIEWRASGSYLVDDLRVYAGGIYSCVKAHTATAQSKPPDKDPFNWLLKQPTNRMAPFDEYIYTATKKAGEIRYVLTPGFFNGYAMYGAEADRVEVALREVAGQEPPLMSLQQEMWQQAFGEWEYLFGNLQRTSKQTRADLPIRPSAELDIRLIRNDPSVDAELGLLAVGMWQRLLSPKLTIGGTQSGAEVTPKAYSYFKREIDGTYTRRKGRVAKNISATVLIDAVEAPRVSRLLEQILDVPVAIEADSLPRHGHISTVGFVTGTVTAVDWSSARVDIKVDGNV